MIVTKYYCIVHFLKGITQESRPFKTYEAAVSAGEEELRRHKHYRGIGSAEYFVVEKRFELTGLNN